MCMVMITLWIVFSMLMLRGLLCLPAYTIVMIRNICKAVIVLLLRTVIIVRLIVVFLPSMIIKHFKKHVVRVVLGMFPQPFSRTHLLLMARWFPAFLAPLNAARVARLSLYAQGQQLYPVLLRKFASFASLYILPISLSLQVFTMR